MGGIDTNDMMVYSYLDERRTVKYWNKVAFNIISRMTLNAYIIYKETCSQTKKPMSHYQFLVSIIDDIGHEWILHQNRTAMAGGDAGLADPDCNLGIQKLPGKQEKTCFVCSSKGSRKRSRTVCARCNQGCHGLCFAKHVCK